MSKQIETEDFEQDQNNNLSKDEDRSKILNNYEVFDALMARDLFSSSEEPSDPVVVNARTRSQSINLPPQEETLRHVGRVLRRLSEDFEQSRGIRTDQRRRGSISRFFNSLS
ncbi:hypothetical protein NPIL_459871 [Nephila pilipes]|uniref:Uncharacterized protein n=1 Tax=Nephila pilipes TaxID=299642 RepID=A0A8X6QRC1_NEPPI|nr:hypothetical protein NPIL_459871 [Nephila pilipes]